MSNILSNNKNTNSENIIITPYEPTYLRTRAHHRCSSWLLDSFGKENLDCEVIALTTHCESASIASGRKASPRNYHSRSTSRAYPKPFPSVARKTSHFRRRTSSLVAPQAHSLRLSNSQLSSIRRTQKNRLSSWPSSTHSAGVATVSMKTSNSSTSLFRSSWSNSSMFSHSLQSNSFRNSSGEHHELW
jgi:hypothetical protein